MMSDEIYLMITIIFCSKPFHVFELQESFKHHFHIISTLIGDEMSFKELK